MVLSKAKAIKILRKYDNEFYTPATRQAHRMGAEALAKDAVEVVHGRWEHKKFWKKEVLYFTKECSICHHSVSPRNEFQYCPHCGAKMDGDISG